MINLSRWKLIWMLLTDSVSFWALRNKEEQIKLDAAEKRIQENFDKKIKMLHFEKEYVGVIAKKYEQPVLYLPVESPYDIRPYDMSNRREMFVSKGAELKQRIFRASFHSDSCSADRIKDQLVQNIARELIDKNYVQTRAVTIKGEKCFLLSINLYEG